MTDRDWRIGICGTFDVQNYGDLLFPLIAEAELSRRLGRVRLHPFSYSCKVFPGWPYAVTSLTELPAVAGDLDGMIIGGGHLIRFDKEVAPGYLPATPVIHHPTGYWLTPALIALQHGRPVVWNAPGVHGDIPGWAEPLMRLAIGLADYVAVRDAPSREALLPFAGSSEIAVVPDTAFGVAQRLEGPPSAAFVHLRDELRLGDRYIVVHATRGLDAFSRLVRGHPEIFAGCPLLALEVGPVLGDDDTQFDRDLPGVIRLPSWPHPLLLAELIGHATAVVGISLHLAITATAFGIPVFRPGGARHGKYAVLAGFDSVRHWPSEGDIDPHWFATRLGRAPISPAVRAAMDSLSDHWDRLAAALTSPPGPRPRALAALGEFWQSLPGILEASARREGAIASPHAVAAPGEQAVPAEPAGGVTDELPRPWLGARISRALRRLFYGSS